jgi:large subunit ribosomal protein L32
MAAQPKRKITTHMQKVRRAAKKLVLGRIGACNHCGEPTRSHRVCPSCGYYKGQPILVVR